MRPEFTPLLDLAKTLPREDLPFLLGELETIRGEILLRMMTPAPVPPDELLTISQAADRLKVSRDYLYRNHRRLPFTRHAGRRLLFSSNALDSYLKKR